MAAAAVHHHAATTTTTLQHGPTLTTASLPRSHAQCNSDIPCATQHVHLNTVARACTASHWLLLFAGGTGLEHDNHRSKHQREDSMLSMCRGLCRIHVVRAAHHPGC
eukprot:m.1389235 g.1389235  ORF g.1389235 m.1389235 type:complete len:107 (+) comp24987_c0_seq59:3582-3902(+)